MASYQTCFDVSPECPVEATTYGYYPVLWANVLFCAIFGLCSVGQLVMGTYYRTWTWMATIALACLLEFAGYLGRTFMHYNPWNNPAYETQIIVIILAPSFLAAGINLTLKHIVLSFDEGLSRLKPRQYTWIFIPIDLSCICLQAVGGGLAASAGDTGNMTILDAGNNIIVTGIVLQVVNLGGYNEKRDVQTSREPSANEGRDVVVFGAVAAEYALRLRRHRAQLGEKLAYAHDAKFRAFLVAVSIAYLTVLVRTIYRIPEMAFGWGSANQRNELEFMVLDGLMIVVAAVSITVVHPGWAFPALASTIKSRARRRRKSERDAVGSGES